VATAARFFAFLAAREAIFSPWPLRSESGLSPSQKELGCTERCPPEASLASGRLPWRCASQEGPSLPSGLWQAPLPGVCSYTAALCKAVGILQGQHERERPKCSDPLELVQELGLGVAFFSDGLQLSMVVVSDALGERTDLLRDGT
jgi:hypothetical protein